jgi:hypothetical protein
MAAIAGDHIDIAHRPEDLFAHATDLSHVPEALGPLGAARRCLLIMSASVVFR